MTFTVQPICPSRAPQYPVRDEITEAHLRNRPYRSGVSRALAAALATLTSGGVAAQGLWGTAQNNSAQYQLAGAIAYVPETTIVELIQTDVANALIARLFAEAGYTLDERDVWLSDVQGRSEMWDSDHRVGVALLGQEDFSTRTVWAHYLQRALGASSFLPDDPRRDAGWDRMLSAKEQAEVETAIAAFGEQYAWQNQPPRLTTPDGAHLLGIDPRNLTVTTYVEGSTPDPQTLVTERAAALQRLEQQVREFLEYLRTQGV